MKYTLIFFLLLGSGWLFAQSTSSPFVSPVHGKIRLSGTFGELRSNHFHTGIDIKSRNGRGGDPILAVADGYVERIRLSAVGYGRALYITHPNGYTSVYAHLDRFHPELEKFIFGLQKAHESAHLDIYPLAETFCFSQGDTIGYMGNSGSSAGPHLHFEIRETVSEIPVNPLKWAFPYYKGSPPYARFIKLYRFDSEGRIHEEKKIPLIRRGREFYLKEEKIEVRPGRYAWAVQAFQPFNKWRNKNGVYALESYVDSVLQFAVCMDRLPFPLNRYINAHIDYPMFCRGQPSMHSLFARPNQEASCIRFDKDRGTILLSDSSSHKVQIRLSDIGGQSADVQFTIEGRATKEVSAFEKQQEQRVNPFEVFRYADDHIVFLADSHTFYSAHPLEISTTCENKGGQYLPTAYLDTDCHPFHKSVKLRFLDLPSWPDSLRAKVYVGRWEDRSWIDAGGHWEGNDFVAKVREEGQYRICVAGSPPELIGVGRAFHPGQRVTFRVQPNTPSQFRVKDIQIKVTYRGQFLPFSYDKKYSRLFLTIPEEWKGKDSLRIELADRWGQSQSYSFPVID